MNAMSRTAKFIVALLCMVSATHSTLFSQIFAPAVQYVVGPRCYFVALEDFDGDGDIDFVASSDDLDTVKVFSNDGKGLFIEGGTFGIGNGVTGIAAVDLDMDGDIDLAITHWFSNDLYVFLNDGHAAFVRDSIYATGGSHGGTLCGADFDGDGDIDLAVPNHGSAKVAIFKNDGAGRFAPPVFYTTGSGPYTAVAGDIDGDGDVDLIVTNNGSTTVGVFLNNGSGVFGSRTDYAVGKYSQSPSLADYDSDGKLDLAVPNASPMTPYVSILRGNGDGTFQPKVDWAGCRPHTVTTADFDLDGKLDMAVANNECDNVSIFPGNGDLTFQSIQSYRVGSGPNTTMARDFDGDGDLDLAVANFDNDGIAGNGVSILLNNTIVVLDTVYTPAGYPDSPLSARIHIPNPAKAKGIGIVMMHGYGAPQTGNQFWRDSLVAHGYLVMAVVHPDMNVANGLYPKLVRAAKTAVQFLRQSTERFGITTGKVVGWGQSQGSMIWGQSIVWDNDHDYFGTNPAISDHVDAAILLYGLYDMFNYMPAWAYDLLTTQFSPNPSLRGTKGQCLTNVSNITTPILLLHATGDPVAYIQHSRMLRDSLDGYGRSVKLIEFGSSVHTFDAVSDFEFSSLGLAAKDSALVFLNNVFGPTSVREIVNDVPSSFVLDQNFPNPFNPSTNIRFTIHDSRFTTLKIYDFLGRDVATLVNEELKPGSYEATWDAAGFPSGVYFYRLRSGEFVETKRLVLMR